MDLVMRKVVSQNQGRTGTLIFANPLLNVAGAIAVPATTLPNFASPGVGLCRVQSDYPVPWVVHIDARNGGAVATSQRMTCQFGNAYGPTMSAMEVGDTGGCLVWEYGDGAIKKRLLTDLRPGTYELPPSTWVNVSVKCYAIDSTFNASGFGQIRVTGTISPGRVSVPSQPMQSITLNLPALAALSYILAIPDGAIAIDAWAGNYNVVAAVGPIIGISGGALSAYGGGMGLVRDYQSGVSIPPGPVPLVQTNGIVPTAAQGMTILNSGPNDALATVAIFQEF